MERGSPTKAFNKLDLPALGFPNKLIKPALKSGPKAASEPDVTGWVGLVGFIGGGPRRPGNPQTHHRPQISSIIWGAKK